MNCNPGDLAIVIRSCCGNEGKIVRCVKLHLHVQFTKQDGSFLHDDGWQTNPALHGWNGKATLTPDHALRPIRQTDGEDEMLRIAGNPQTKELAK